MVIIKCLLFSFFLNLNKNILSAKTKNVSDVFYLKYENIDAVNYTWPTTTSQPYKNAVKSGQYIRTHNKVVGLKMYKNTFYFAIPRLLNGIPVTMASVSKRVNKIDLLKPFPSWEMNVQPDCNTLQSVMSMEINTDGVMWIIDGQRTHNQTKCPPKLVLIDLNHEGKVIHRYIFPKDISLTDGGFLNDIVIDNTPDGTYAYITDSSLIDAGLIVYSKTEDKAWKFRNKRMSTADGNCSVHDSMPDTLDQVNGIALSPSICTEYNTNPSRKEKFVFYTSLTTVNLYKISTTILKNETYCLSDQWRRNVRLVGRKESLTDGMIFDNEGNLFYSLLPLNAVGKWQCQKSFKESKIIAKNNVTLFQPNAFAFDNINTLYFLGGKTIATTFTETKNYLYD